MLLYFVVSLKIQFVLPETYPDAVPQMVITSQSGLADEQVEEIEALLKTLVRVLQIGQSFGGALKCY